MTLLDQLEAERLDLSYRIPADKKKTISVDRSQSLLDIYYHAGRYAAGARDSMAVTNHTKLEVLLEKGN